MKHKYILAVTSCFLIIGATRVVAATPDANLFACTARGSSLGLCVVDTSTLASVDEAHADLRGNDVEYQVTYSFACSGNAVHFAFNAGGSEEVPVSLGASHEVIQVSGPGTAHLALVDIDPSNTSLGKYRPGCRLNVESVTLLPARATVLAWQVEAALRSAAIDSALASLQLASSLDKIIDYDNQQFKNVVNATQDTIAGAIAEFDLTWTQLINPATGRFWSSNDNPEKLPAAWSLAITAHPELVDLVLLHDFAIDITAGRPPATSRDVVTTAALHVKSLSSRYLAKLREKIAEGEATIARAQRYLAVLEADLNKLSADVANARKDYTALN